MTDSEMTPPVAGTTETKKFSAPPPPPPVQNNVPPPPTIGGGDAPKLQGNFPQNPAAPGVTPPPMTSNPPPATPPVRPHQMQSDSGLSGNEFTQTPQQESSEQSAEKGFSVDQYRSMLQNKSLLIAFACIFIFGFSLGACFFSGGNNQKAVAQQSVGLSGVVPNPEPNVARLSRCGRVERGQPCLIYIVNHSRYEKYAENFFDEASRLTEVSRHSISMDNLQYAKTLIRPGQIAEIKVPAL